MSKVDVSERLHALKWYFDSKELALKNALTFRCPLSVEKTNELRQCYSEYFASLISATELLLEKEYEYHKEFNEDLKNYFVFESEANGDENYAYIRELRNSIIHRGFDISSAAHVANNNFLLLVAPEVINNRSDTKKYKTFSYYLIDIIFICEAKIGFIIYKHLERVGLLECPQVLNTSVVEKLRQFIDESNVMPDYIKAVAKKQIEDVNFQHMQQDAIRLLKKALNKNVFKVSMVFQ